jgi:hypothetical protein
MVYTFQFRHVSTIFIEKTVDLGGFSYEFCSYQTCLKVGSGYGRRIRPWRHLWNWFPG